MLHRVLCVTTVEILCCHNANPHILRDELMRGSCQLYTWPLDLMHALSFNFPLKQVGINVNRRYHHLVRTWKKRKKSDSGEKFQNLKNFELKLSNASHFETKFSHRVRFWYKDFTMHQISDWKKYKALDFELKSLRRVGLWWKNFKKDDLEGKSILKKHDFEKNLYIQKITFLFNLNRKMRKFFVSLAIWKAQFWRKKNSGKHAFGCTFFQKKLDFEWKSFC